MLGSITLFEAILYLTDVGLTILLNISKYCLLHSFRSDEINHILEHITREVEVNILMLLFTAFSNDGIEETYDLTVQIMSSVDGLDHKILRNLICSGLDHDNLITC